MNGNTTIAPITDFIRRTKYYEDLLCKNVREIVLTRDGWPFMEVKLTNQERNRRLLALAGTWKGTELDDDKLWAKVFVRRNRKTPIKL